MVKIGLFLVLSCQRSFNDLATGHILRKCYLPCKVTSDLVFLSLQYYFKNAGNYIKLEQIY